MKKNFLWAIIASMTLPLYATAQNADTTAVTKPEGYQFTDTKVLPTTPIKNQAQSGTCWSFAGIALLENELLRMGKPEYDLSEMWIVRYCYLDKLARFVRYHGKVEFAGGGGVIDVPYVATQYGLVPEEVYAGLNYGEKKHNHGELDRVMRAYADAIVSGNKPTTAWLNGAAGILDAYLGEVPETFTYNDKQYTPQSFAASLGLNMDDYVCITSFTHHPFYTTFPVEVPDNWLQGDSYNVPLDELVQIVDAAIDNGYSVLWAADVSEKGFNRKGGFMVCPAEKLREDMSEGEWLNWSKMTEKEREEQQYKLDAPGKELTVTQEMRQQAYDNYETTDDHGTQRSTVAVDQIGNKYYKVKNSWSTENGYDGYYYVSIPYFRYKTLNIVVNKHAIPADLRAKMGIK